MSVYIDIHGIQTVGPSNLNRDLNGSPKTALYGGVRRARVSSQSWKRPMRLDFRDKYSPENLGIRTKRIVELLANRITSIAPELEPDAVEMAVKSFNTGGIKIAAPKKSKGEAVTVSELQPGYLVFVSEAQIDNAAKIAVEAFQMGGIDEIAKKKADLKSALKSDLSVDLALFGRMIADDADLNVEASCQVAHAISTHAAGTEFDFFTAVDDEKARSEDTDAGAGMLGTVEFTSATLYRYATINATALADQLGSVEAASRAVAGFVDVFATSLPTGKQNTFASQTLPTAVLVSIRESRPMSLVGAFESPVHARRHPDAPATGYTLESVRRMVQHASNLEEAYGSMTTENLVFATSDAKSILLEEYDPEELRDTLIDLANSVASVVEERLGEQ